MDTAIKQYLTAYEYILSTSERVRQICQPLQYLGISYFGYLKLFNDGSYLMLDNNLEIRKAFFNTITNQGSYFSNIHNFRRLEYSHNAKYRYALIPTDIGNFNRKKDPIMHLVYNLNVWNCFCIYKDGSNYTESYTFGINRSDSVARDFYWQELPLLERFIDYFHEQAINLIDTSNPKKLTYFAQKFNFNNGFKKQITPVAIRQFLQETNLQSHIIQGKAKKVKLSRREVECLKHLSHGYSFKEMGKILGLAPRTIEFYLHNAKQKTGYSSKEELLTQFIINNGKFI